MHSATAPEVCASCGSTTLPDGNFCLFCGDLLTESGKQLSLTRSGSPHAGATDSSGKIATVPFADTTEYAGFWRRVWAGCIDVVLETVIALLLTLMVDTILHAIGGSMGIAPESMEYVTGITFIVLLTIGAWLYCAFSESSRYRATLGKQILGLQVVNAAGGKLTFGQASVRHFMKFLSLFTAGFGFMMAGWTKRRQALHDMPHDCRVIRVPQQSLSLFGR